MVQNLRAYFMRHHDGHVITIKWVTFVQEKIEFAGMTQRPRLRSTKISGDLSFVAKVNQQ